MNSCLLFQVITLKINKNGVITKNTDQVWGFFTQVGKSL